MARIKLMNKELAGKIAAGEVVERPASVVKELVENSIDAGAENIFVFLEDGGKRMIKVIDDGSGMTREDAELSFSRHATSKLLSEEDLENIRTMGFRGEALPSIEAVSRMTLTTRTADEAVGTLISFDEHNDGEMKTEEAGTIAGTTVEVRDLFYNIPARKKFLRTPQTEYTRIMELIKTQAISRPDVKFKLIHGTSRPFEAKRLGLKDRLGEVFHKDVYDNLVEVPFFEIKDKGYKVWGFVGSPELSYKTQKNVHVYLKTRPVKDRTLTRAVLDGFRGVIEQGRYPFAVIFIDTPASEFDVNVHPAKTEVRFIKPSLIYDVVKAAVTRAVSGIGISASTSLESKAQNISTDMGAGSDNRRSDGGSVKEESSFWHTAGSPNRIGGGVFDNVSRARENAINKKYDEARQNAQGDIAETPLPFVSIEEDVVTSEFLEMEVVGQLWGEYLVTQSLKGEFFIIDQHGAAERAVFERLRKQFLSGDNIKGQYLLVPERVETTAEERDVLMKHMGYLEKLGFEVTPFGSSTEETGETFIIKAVPDVLTGKSAKSMIKDLIEELSEIGGSRVIEEKVEDILMTIACHSVIRGVRPMGKEEATGLLRELSKVDLAAHCPHGRPVIKKFTRDEVEVMFGRR